LLASSMLNVRGVVGSTCHLTWYGGTCVEPTTPWPLRTLSTISCLSIA
jgi:hypothetical protein